jgi:hypothetical protein
VTVPPLDGPHTPAGIIAAARVLDDAVRYLNHATTRPVLNNPADLAAVLAALHAATVRLPQLFDQLAHTVDRYVLHGGLYDNQGGNPHVTAADVALRLRDTQIKTGWLIDPLQAACEACARLGIQNTNVKEN